MAEPEVVSAECLGAVFAEYQGEMSGKARKLLHTAGVPESVADADDIVSTAFHRALREPAAVREPRAYLHKVIRTEVAFLARRQAERHRLEEEHAATLRSCLPPPVAADFTALVDNREAVHRAVQELTVPQRTAVWATCALDYTRGETAVLMDKHPGTVARHCTRAVLLLRAAIAAAVVAVLTVFGLAVSGGLQRTTPADAPRRVPPLPSVHGWAGKEALPWIALTLYLLSWVVVIARRRARQHVPTRLGLPQPVTPHLQQAARQGASTLRRQQRPAGARAVRRAWHDVVASTGLGEILAREGIEARSFRRGNDAYPGGFIALSVAGSDDITDSEVPKLVPVLKQVLEPRLGGRAVRFMPGAPRRSAGQEPLMRPLPDAKAWLTGGAPAAASMADHDRDAVAEVMGTGPLLDSSDLVPTHTADR